MKITVTHRPYVAMSDDTDCYIESAFHSGDDKLTYTTSGDWFKMTWTRTELNGKEKKFIIREHLIPRSVILSIEITEVTQ